MVQLKVGDAVTMCASIWDFCGQQFQYYSIEDINVSTGTCSINIDNSISCLDISGVLLEFQWVNSRNTSSANECADSTKLKVLGSAYTNSQGVASIGYQIALDDLTLFQNNPEFELRVCIKNKTPQEVFHLGELRSRYHGLDYITIIPNPCTGIICENACIGLDLYSQKCADGICVTDTLITQNSPLCGAIQEKHYLYFKVPELYPVSYVMSGMSLIFQVALYAIRAYVDYYVEAVDFDQSSYIITVTIAKTFGLGSRSGLGPRSGLELGLGTRMQTMILPAIPIAYYLAVAAGIIAATLSVLILGYLGSKSVTGEQISTRVITVIPQICTGNADTGIPSCANPTPPMIISIERCLGDVCETVEIADGNPITFSAPTNVGITITGKVKNNSYYTVIKQSIDKGITNETVTLWFTSKADATITPEAKDYSTNNPINGSYVIQEETTDGYMVEVQRGNLDASGKVSPPFKAKTGVKTCTIIIPSDLNVHNTQMKCITPSAGEILTLSIPIKTCSEAKNGVSVRTVYIASDGSRLGYTADNIQVKVGSSIINTVIPTNDITYIDGLDKNTNYTVHVTKSNYTMLNNDQQVSFTTDCDTTTALIVESNPPAGARDITIVVKNATTNTAIYGANVTLDTMPTKKTGSNGTVLLTAIPDGNHDLKITLEAYKDNISEINVSSTSTLFTKTLIVDQVNATVDTRIYNFANVGDAIATKPIKFGGTLQYLDTNVSPPSYEALTDATVIVTIKDIGNNILQTLATITKNGLTELGDFETGEWVIPNGLANTQINVDTTFEGIGRYKASSSSTSYAVAAADACVIPLPWGGCLLSKETGQSILLLGGLAILGYIVLSSSGRSIIGSAPTRERVIVSGQT